MVRVTFHFRFNGFSCAVVGILDRVLISIVLACFGQQKRVCFAVVSFRLQGLCRCCEKPAT